MGTHSYLNITLMDTASLMNVTSTELLDLVMLGFLYMGNYPGNSGILRNLHFILYVRLVISDVLHAKTIHQDVTSIPE
jgi:hypothetical protein